VKIGVLADTHIPNQLPALPDGVRRAFRGLDIILHAGDICQLKVLRALQDEYTLTFAVYGEDDDPEVRRYLLSRQVVEFRKRRIGLLHGDLTATLDWKTRLLWAIRRPPTEEILDRLLARFVQDQVDCIVFGHTHRPLVQFYKGVLFFNPGAVVGGRGQRPTVGILNITDRSITADVIGLWESQEMALQDSGRRQLERNRRPGIVRFEAQGRILEGLLIEDEIFQLDGWQDKTPVPGARLARLADVRLAVPCDPSKVIAVGRNYTAHAAEHGAEVPEEPLFFLKPPSSVIAPHQAIVHPTLSQQVEYEAELAVVIGRKMRKVAPGAALAGVLGYTCAMDITARDLQHKDGQWTRAKGFDTFCPLGPWIVPGLDPGDLLLECRVNGEVRQRARTSDMVFPVEEIIARASQVMTLEPGDVILTGTPAGVGPLHPGDQVEVEIEGIGVLQNHVIKDGVRP